MHGNLQGETSTSYTDNAALASLGLKKLTLMERTSSSASLSSNGSNEYGVVPTALAEEVLRGNRYLLLCLSSFDAPCRA